jgi:hypothetical protein
MSELAIDQAREPRLGDRVQIYNLTGMRGRIVELRGGIGPKGEQVYGIELDYGDYTRETIATRSQLVFLDDGNDPDHPNPPTSANP